MDFRAEKKLDLGISDHVKTCLVVLVQHKITQGLD